MSLQAKLNAFKAQFESGAPPYNVTPEVVATMHKATDELKRSGLVEQALQVGEHAPAFMLPNERNQMVNSRELLTTGPLIVTFFRGTW
jgi:hypothetical protein